MSNIDQWVGIQFVADADTPADATQWDQKIFLVAPEYMANIGSGPSNPGVLMGVRGYHVTGGPTGHQWLMTGPVTNAVRDQIGQIPGAQGWLAPGTRATYRQAAAQLIRQHGVPAPDVISILTDLYNAAAANATTAPPGG